MLSARAQGRPTTGSRPLPQAYVLAIAAGLLLVLAVLVSAAWPGAAPVVVVAEQGWDGAPIDQELMDRTRRSAADLGADTVLILVRVESLTEARIPVRLRRNDTLDDFAARFGVDPKTLTQDNPGAFDKNGMPRRPEQPVTVRIGNPYGLPDGRAGLSARAVTGRLTGAGPGTAVLFTSSDARPVVNALAGVAVVVDEKGAVLAEPAGQGTVRALRMVILITWAVMVAVLGLLAVRLLRSGGARARPSPPVPPVIGDQDRDPVPPAPPVRPQPDPQPEPVPVPARQPDPRRFDFGPWASPGRSAEPPERSEQCPRCGAFGPLHQRGVNRCAICQESWRPGDAWLKVVLDHGGTFTDPYDGRGTEGMSQ